MLRRRTRHRNAHRTPLIRSAALGAAFAVAAVVAGCTAPSGSETTTPANVEVVVSEPEGDTLTVNVDGRREKVRLIGVDTPETVHPTKGVQCFGPEASEFTKKTLAVGTKVKLVRDVEARDRYGRLLAYVYLFDSNVFYNRELVRLGYARPYPFPPNTSHEATFATAADEARRDGRGLWSACGD